MHKTSPCIHNELLQVGISKLKSDKLKHMFSVFSCTLEN